MKTQIFKIFLILTLFLGFGLSVSAQQNQNSAEQEFEEYERNLSQTAPTNKKTKTSKKPRPTTKPTKRPTSTQTNRTRVTNVGAPGMKIWIERQTSCAGQFSSVAPTAVFRSDDCIRMRFLLNFEGYLTIINLGTTGTNSIKFPLNNQSNRILPKTDYYLPDNEGWEFDETPGNEQFIFIVSRVEIKREFIEGYLNSRNAVTNNSSDFEVYDRDIKPRSEKDSIYVLSDETRLEKPIVFRMTVKHH